MDKDRLERFTSGDGDFQMYTLEELMEANKEAEQNKLKPIKASAELDPKKITNFSINQAIDDEL